MPVTVTLSNYISLLMQELPAVVVEQLQARLSFPNPKFIENQKRGFSNWRVPETLRCYHVREGRLYLPRGFTRTALGLLKEHGLAYTLDDRRRTLPEQDFRFLGKPRDFQIEAVDAALARDFGVVAAPTGSGKTVMALFLIALRRQPALVVVHTKELLHQWVERAREFLGLYPEEIGIVGLGDCTVGARLTVALVQSLYKYAHLVAPHIGFLVVDECHRAPARTFTAAVTVFDCKYMLGLSATPWRRDGLSRLIYYYLGSKVYEIERQELTEAGHLVAAEVIYRPTAFLPSFDPSSEYSQMLSELAADPERNALIVADVVREAGSGVSLVLSDRKSHCQALAALLAEQGVAAAVLTGDLSPRQRQAVVAAVQSGQVRVLLATGQLIGEGFDCPGLANLFLATPIRFSGRVLQYLGRVLRPAPGKDRAKVYDYQDVHVGVLVNAARARARVYAAA